MKDITRPKPLNRKTSGIGLVTRPFQGTRHRTPERNHTVVRMFFPAPPESSYGPPGEFGRTPTIPPQKELAFMRTRLEGRFAMRVALLILACTLLPAPTHAQAQPTPSGPTVTLSRIDESHALKNGIQ